MAKSYLDEVNKKRAAAAARKQREQELKTANDAVASGTDKVAHEVARQSSKNRTSTQKVQVENENLADKTDIQSVINELKEVQLATLLSGQNKPSVILADSTDLGERMGDIGSQLTTLANSINDNKKSETELKALGTKFETLAKAVSSLDLGKDLKGDLQAITQAISGIDVKPIVNVPVPKVSVESPGVDLSPISGLLGEVKTAISKIKLPKQDDSGVIEAVNSIKTAINGLTFPVPNYVLPFKDPATGKATQVTLDSDGKVPISGTINAASDGAIVDGVTASIKATVFDYVNSNPVAARLTDTNGDYVSVGGGTQYTEDAAAAADPVGTAPMLVRKDTPAATVSTDGDNVAQRGTNYGAAYVTLLDSSGNPVSVGGGTQYDEDTVSTAADKLTMAGAVRKDTAATLVDTDGDRTQLQVDASGRLHTNGSGVTQPVSAASLPLPAGASTAAKQPALGTAGTPSADVISIQGVASGTVVPISDGGGSLTVDGTVGVSGAVDTELTTADLDTGAGTDTRAVVGLVGSKSGGGVLIPGDATAGLKVDLGTDNDVTVTGTVTANLAAGTNNIGDVDILTIAAGDNNIGNVDIVTMPDVTVVGKAADGAAVSGNPVLIAGQDGTNVQSLKTDATGSLQVDVESSALPTGASTLAEQQTQTTALQKLDNIAHSGSDVALVEHVPISGQFDDAATTTVTENQIAPVRITSGRALHTSVRDALPAGANAIGKLAANDAVDIGDVTINNAAGASAVNIQDGGNSITVDGAVTTSGTVTEANSGAILTSTQLLDDTVKTLGTDTYTEATTKGNLIGAIRRDADTTLVDTTNEVSPLQVDANGRLKVEAFSGETLPTSNATTSVVGNGAAATAQRVTLANDSTGVLSTVSTVTSLTQMNGAAIAMNTGVRAAGVQRVTIATDDIVPASQSGTWTVQPGNTANSTAWLVSDRPATSGGLDKFHLVGAATDNATNVKASAGQVYSITAFNVSTSPRFLKFHNTAGTPTAGTGVTDTYLIPGNTGGAGVVINLDKGISFSTGIGITLVTGIADANTTAIGASEVVINIYYK